jgi:DNA-binding MarR family transcriptional regulator
MTTELEALGLSIKRLQYRHHRSMELQLARVGTTLAQWDALRAIDAEPGASAHSLATVTFQSDQSFGTLAHRLENQGLIERLPGTGRRIEHRLTEQGSRMLAAGYPIAAGVLSASFAALSENQRAMLYQLVNRALDSAL